MTEPSMESDRHESADAAQRELAWNPDDFATLPELPAFLAYAQGDQALGADIALAQEGAIGLLDPTEEIAMTNQMDGVREDAQQSVAELLKKDEASQDEVIDIESPDTLPEIKKAAADAGISMMRNIIDGIEDCVVFASTALYLQGVQRGIVEFQVPPGDFDAAVQSEDALRRIQERLTNVPGAEFKNEGKWKRMGGGAEVLSGQIVMDIQTPMGEKRVAYPFEFFLRTFIADVSVLRYQEKLAGFNVLTMEGLQNQYLNNLKFESRVGSNTEAVAKFLMNSQVERQLQNLLDGADDPVAEQILKRLDLTQEDLRKFYEIRGEMMSSLSASGETLEERLSDLAVLLSGFKTKIPKRQKNIEQLQKARQVD